MRSSGSTRSPSPRSPVRLYIVLEGEDHPKACTGRRLLHRRLATRPDGTGARPIVLDPHASRPLSPTDAALAARDGILAVDCSWNRLARRGRLPDGPRGIDPAAPHRRLPILIATNPQHFGRPTELNTVEALAAATYLLDRRDQARSLLEGFRGGLPFLDVNRERLEAYAGARDAEAVRVVERRLFGGAPEG